MGSPEHKRLRQEAGHYSFWSRRRKAKLVGADVGRFIDLLQGGVEG